MNKPVATFAAADIDAIPITAVESEARDCERLALRAGSLYPVIAAAGNIAAVTDLGNHALEPDLTGVSKYLSAIDFKAVTELDIGMLDDSRPAATSADRGRLGKANRTRPARSLSTGPLIRFVKLRSR